ncbi:MAG: adenylate/guanylate cyclase [Myxococcaceae bacterium]|nr:adenylate/guanylate cyclase [Myxococcaceae bacterium]
MFASCRFGEFELDARRFELRRQGQRVPVQPKVLKLLIYLVTERTRALSIEELMREVWPHENVTDASLRRAVRGARRALGDGEDTEAYVRTVRGRGYQFVQAVEEEGPDPARTSHEPAGGVRLSLSETQVSELSRLALFGLPRLRPRRALSHELVRFAQQQGESLMLVRGCLAQVQDGLELGRLHEVDSAIGSLESLAAQDDAPLLHWYVALFRTMRATVDGRFGQAEWLARHALRIGQCAGEAAHQAYAIQTLWIFMQQGRFAEAERLVSDICEQNPGLAAWRTALACIEAFMGKQCDMRADLRRAFSAPTLTPDEDPFPVSDFAPAAELCAMAQDAECARVLYHVLLPLADEHAVVSVGLATHGPLARQLGMLAGCTGDFEAARTHFQNALRHSVQMPSAPLTALAAYEYARVLVQEKACTGRCDVALLCGLLSWALAIATALEMDHVARSCKALREARP